MEKKLLFGSLLALSFGVHAQATWNGSGTTGNAYRSGNIGINVSSPAAALDISTSTANDGISINQTGSGFSTLRLLNGTTGGHNYALISTGNGSSEGAGHFGLYDYTASLYRYFVNSYGNTGIGTISPLYKLHIESDDNNMTNGNVLQSGGYLNEPTFSGTYSKLSVTSKNGVHAAVEGYDLNNRPNTNGNYLDLGIGVFGKSERTISGLNSVCVGISGNASGAVYNAGGAFIGNTYTVIASKSSSNQPGKNPGTSFGIWASARNGIAGYFNGNVYSTGSYQSADDITKSDIRPLINAMDRLKLLKPTTFSFKTDEYNNLNLPSGLQMGLSAQDLEKDFPELVQEIRDLSNVLVIKKTGDFKNYKAVNYTNLIPLLIGGAQEQQKQVEDLKNLVAIQQQQINDLLAKSSGATGIDQLNTPVVGFSMEQNIPNPFNNETVVNYSLPQSVNNAYVAVYDLTGKQVTTFPVTAGSSSVTITSEKLSPGIYIYSIITDGKVMDSKRMIVLGK